MDIKKIEMRNYLPFLVCSKYGFLSITQLRIIHRNLGHPFVEKQIIIIKN